MTIDEKGLQAAIPVGSNIANEQLVRAIIEAYESAKQKEAEGWVLVPKEPTDEHLRAMLAVDEPATFRHHLRHPDNGPSMVKTTELKIERARAMYGALLSAGGEDAV